jgi:hypothetical protein
MITQISHMYYLLDKKAATIRVLFEEYKAKVELHSHMLGKHVRMDGGSEYLGMFKVFLEGTGIDMDTTARYSPESNGVSERLNRILLDATRMMLFASNLPNRLWPEAVSTALYLKNRLPPLLSKRVHYTSPNVVQGKAYFAQSSCLWVSYPFTHSRRVSQGWKGESQV